MQYKPVYVCVCVCAGSPEQRYRPQGIAAPVNSSPSESKPYPSDDRVHGYDSPMIPAVGTTLVAASPSPVAGLVSPMSVERPLLSEFNQVDRQERTDEPLSESRPPPLFIKQKSLFEEYRQDDSPLDNFADNDGACQLFVFMTALVLFF